jgi:hypothetical protein
VPSADVAVLVLSRDGVDVAAWPIAMRRVPDLELVDRLARLQLAARRLACDVRVRCRCPRLAELVDLVGLELVVEVLGQPEVREQLLVEHGEEVVEPDDPVA